MFLADEEVRVVGRIQSELWDVALDQHGFVTTNDARTLGVNPLELVKLAARNQLLKVGHGIYRFPQLPTESLDSYMLAVLWARGVGVISHDTALDLHELCEINPDRIHLTVPGRRPRRAGGDGYVIHHGVLAPEEVTRSRRHPDRQACRRDPPGNRVRRPFGLAPHCDRDGARARLDLANSRE